MTLADVGPVLLVGAGKMGGAMLDGWLGRGLDPALTTILDPAPPVEVAELVSARGARLNPEVPGSPPPVVVVLAVKPQVVGKALTGLIDHIAPDSVVMSIAAGKTIDSLGKLLPEGQPVVRAMPNTPSAVGRGFTVCLANGHVTEPQKAAVNALLEASGEVAWIEDEGQMDAVTGVSGSGPAYVFLLAECLAEAGRAAGLGEEFAARLARATVAGAGELLHRSPLDTVTLRQNVTSPAGTTAAALEVLMAENGLALLMKEAVAAAAKRAGELAD